MFEPTLPASVEDIHFDELEFWTAPIEKREGAFALLRRENFCNIGQGADQFLADPVCLGYAFGAQFLQGDPVNRAGHEKFAHFLASGFELTVQRLHVFGHGCGKGDDLDLLLFGGIDFYGDVLNRTGDFLFDFLIAHL